MSTWLRSLIAPQPPREPQPFSGQGVFLTSEVHSPRTSSGHFPPMEVVKVVSRILDYQIAIVERRGGSIEQCVGDCVLAYWKPGDLEKLAVKAYETACQLVAEKPSFPNLTFYLRIHFIVGEIAGAHFGPHASRRFQVVGHARDLANTLPRIVGSADYVATNLATFEILPVKLRDQLIANGPDVFAHIFC